MQDSIDPVEHVSCPECRAEVTPLPCPLTGCARPFVEFKPGQRGEAGRERRVEVRTCAAMPLVVQPEREDVADVVCADRLVRRERVAGGNAPAVLCLTARQEGHIAG